MFPARAIAEEHCETMEAMGFAPWQVCVSVGTYAPVSATWEDARLAVALAWVEIAKTDRRAAL